MPTTKLILRSPSCAVVAMLLLGAATSMAQTSSGELPMATDELIFAPSEEIPGVTGAPERSETGATKRAGLNVLYQTHMRAFSHFAVGAKIGLEGVGLDVATPLSNKWNLRGGASFLNANISLTVHEDSSSFGTSQQATTVAVDARPRFRSVMATLDWFPWYGSFRVSPGVTLYNGNRGTAVAIVAGGEVLSVGTGDYTSDPANPIRADVTVRLGHTVAPRLTVGWGNMIPRAGQHFSFPFEAGVEYVGQPQMVLTLAGGECDRSGKCYPITLDSSTQANLAQEQQTINNDIAPLRFYPILTTGVSYRF